LSIIAILAVLACSGGADHEKSQEEDDKPEPSTLVEAVAVAEGSVADVLTSSAVIESESSANLVPEAAGVVREIRKDEGDPVERGDVLAVLDNVALNTGARRATAEVTRLQQRVDAARELLDRGAISVREVEDLDHQLASAKLSSREASSSYGSTRITAPFDGVVAMRDVRVGELATSGRTAFQVVDPDKLRIVSSLPERDLGRLAVGQPARLVSAYDEEVWSTGTVQRISPVVDANSGTFRVTLGVDPHTGGLRPGQFVQVRIEVDRHEDVLVVPKQALLYEDGAPVVYVVGPAPPPEPDEDAEEEEEEEEEEAKLAGLRTPVKLGLVDDAFAEITEGLSAGDQVIVIGHSHLRDGGIVRVAGAEDAGG